MTNLDFDIKLMIVCFLLSALAISNAFRLSMALRNRHQPKEPRPPASFGKRVVRGLWAWKWSFLNVTVLLIAGLISLEAISPLPTVMSSYPAQEGHWQDYGKPVEINFNVPVSIASLHPNISREEVKGEWVYVKYLGILPFTRKALFYPDSTLPPEQRLVVYMTGIKRPGVNEYHEHATNFFTHQLPEVFATAPINSEKNVVVDQPITIELDKQNVDLAEWKFEFSDEVEFNTSQVGNKFILTPTTPLQQGETYDVKVYRTAIVKEFGTGQVYPFDNPTLINEFSFSTVRSPLVESFQPTGRSVKVDEPVIITFEEEMDQASVQQNLQVSPAFGYTATWKNNRTLHVTPVSPLEKETDYLIKIVSGARTRAGGVLNQDATFTFTTIGSVKVITTAPTNNGVRISRTSNISITFDQEVDHASAQSKFSIAPNIAGNFSWSGNTMTFDPSGSFNFSTTYTVVISPGIASVFGLPGKETYSFVFTTVPNQTIIAGFGPEDWDKQDFTFSCGVAATKMALAWKGISASENTLINQMGRDTSVMNCSSGTCYWGDPNRNYLGDPNGSGAIGTGQSAYGVHWEPIRRILANNYNITSVLRRNWSQTGLAAEVNAGRPVLVFWWNGVSSYYGTQGGKRVDWIDSATGNPVEAINGMHAILIVGYLGDVGNPTGFIALDPWYGYRTYTTANFNNQWPKLQNTGLIIY